MVGLITDLSVAAKLAARSIKRRRHGDIEALPNLVEFKRGMEEILIELPDGIIAETAWLSIPAQQAPWVASSISLKAGQEVSYFVEGRVIASKFLDVWVNPEQQIWAKIGKAGTIFRGTQTGHSFKSEQDGVLSFGNYFPNDWANNQGERLQGDKIYKKVSGECLVLVIRWAGRAADGLAALQKQGDYEGRIEKEIARLKIGDVTPKGWSHLWNVGPSEIFKSQTKKDGADCIHCDTHKDVAILQYDIAQPLTKESEISWEWRLDEIPSLMREDTLPTHDYLSIAVEFDDGRDISYFWSRDLPFERGFDCPLPNWKGKEYHVVVRSGTDELGKWVNERRNLYQDYLRYMGKPPANIVRVWLIANSVFQRQKGICTYSNIELHGDGKSSRIL